jgi:uncharacterized protein (DUF1015 family)
MAMVRPFRALRYDVEQAGPLKTLVAPPYDVISPRERDAFAAADEHSVVRLILPDSPNAAADLLYAWTREGVLRRDDEPAMWWHEQRFTGPDGVDRTRGGVVAAVALSPYQDGLVRPHERTMASHRQGRLDLMRSVHANLSPIFALYDDPDDRARAALAPRGRPPDMEVTDRDGTVHRYWRCDDQRAMAAAADAVGDRPILIADGHHRYETALVYQAERRARDGDPPGRRPYDSMMMCLVNLHGEGLAIFPTHRVAERVAGFTPHTFPAFSWQELPAGTPGGAVEAELNEIPRDRVAFGAWRGADQPAYVATLTDALAARMAMPGVPREIRSLDAAVLEAMVLAPLLGVESHAFADVDGVRYVRELDTATSLVDTGQADVAFLLRAPTVAQVQAVAAAGHVMPQKSTYFFPKLYSGFLINPLDDG